MLVLCEDIATIGLAESSLKVWGCWLHVKADQAREAKQLHIAKMTNTTHIWRVVLLDVTGL